MTDAPSKSPAGTGSCTNQGFDSRAPLADGQREEPNFLLASANQTVPPTQSRPPARKDLPLPPRSPEETIPKPPLLYWRRSARSLLVEALKPKLKQWVDKNLEQLVEELIRPEIQQTARRK